MEVDFTGEIPLSSECPCRLTPSTQMQTRPCPPCHCTAQADHSLRAAKRTLEAGPWRTSCSPAGPPLCTLQGSAGAGAGAAPGSLPPLDDGDDIVHLDVQLVWFLKVLKGPHISGLGLRVETGTPHSGTDHCLDTPEPAGRPAPTSSRKSLRATKVGLSSGL